MKRLIFAGLAMISLLCAAEPDPKAVVIKINDLEYNYETYNQILQNYFEYYSEGQTLSTERQAELNDQCFEELVGRYIYDNAIAAGMIALSEQELLTEAKRKPPAGIEDLPDLRTNGRFDQAKYEQALANFPDFKQAVLDAVREMYQYHKLLDTIKARADVDPDSVKAQWLKDNDTVDAKIIFFDYLKLTHVKASDEEARMYYEEKKNADYRRENGRQLHFVHFPKVPSAADSLATLEKMRRVQNELGEGADFAALAREHSKDSGSAENGGDLGWFGRGRMVQEFEQAAFSTAVGQISEPVKTRYGWHIIQVLDRRDSEQGEEISARHILFTVTPSDATLRKLKIDSSALYELAKSSGLEEAAKQLGWELKETPPFLEQDGFIRFIGREPELVAFAFANPVGSLANMVYAPSGDIFVCEVSAILPEWFVPYEEERASIQNRATRTKRMYYMDQYVQNFLKNVKPENYLAQAARDSILVVEVTSHTIDSPITSIGNIEALNQALFSTTVGSFSQLIEDNKRWFLAQPERRNKPDLADWERDMDSIIAKARAERRQKYLNDWYFNERKKLSLIDNRADYYDLSSTRKMIKL